MHYSVQILSTGSKNSSPSILFKFENKRILFNCGEGSQRLFNHHRVRLYKFDHLFLTKFHWDAIGGVPGLLLTKTGVVPEKSTHLHSPCHSNAFLNTIQRFLPQGAINCTPHTITLNHSSSFYFEEDDFKILPLFTHTSTTNTTTATATTSSFSSPSENLEASPLTSPTSTLSLSPLPSPSKKKRSFSPSSESNFYSNKKYFSLEGEKMSYGSSTSLEPDHNTCVSYICMGPEVRGKFDNEKANALGIGWGKIRSQIINQGSATLPDGRVIHRDMVLGPSKPSYLFFILEIPTLDHLQQLQTHALLQLYQTRQDLPNRIIFHFLGPSVIHSNEYITFLNSFPSNLNHHHYVFSPDHQSNPIVLTKPASAHTILHHRMPHIFLPYQYASTLPLPSTFPSNVQLAKPLVTLQIEPNFETQLPEFSEYMHSDVPISEWSIVKQNLNLLRSKEKKHPSSPKTNSQSERQENHSIQSNNSVNPEVLNESMVSSKGSLSSSSFSTPLEKKTDNQMEKEKDWILVPLGTGSACPALLRNVSSILLSTPKTAILMDCGEGTLGQLSHVFSLEPLPSSSSFRSSSVLHQRYPTLPDFFHHLNIIFISHLHADHHLGLISLLLNITHPITLIAPTRFWQYLLYFHRILPLPLHLIKFLDCEELLFAPRPHSSKFSSTSTSSSSTTTSSLSFLQSILERYDLDTIETCDVIHRARCYGIRIANEGKSIVYSGDTRPCPRLIDMGLKGTDVLIHECTFEADRKEEAILKTHSTITEAISVFKQMKAKKLLLTHFSQRYPKYIPLDREMEKSSILSALDLMVIPLNEFHEINTYRKEMKNLFLSAEFDEPEETDFTKLDK